MPSRRTPSAHLPDSRHESEQSDENRHQADVDELDPAFQRLDAAAQLPAHVAKLAADRQALLAKPGELALLGVGEDEGVLALLRLLEREQPFLGLLEPQDELFLLLPETRLRLAAQRIDALEGAQEKCRDCAR